MRRPPRCSRNRSNPASMWMPVRRSRRSDHGSASCSHGEHGSLIGSRRARLVSALVAGAWIAAQATAPVDASSYMAPSGAATAVAIAAGDRTSIDSAESRTSIAVVGDIACSPQDVDFNRGRGRNGDCKHAAVARLIRERQPDQLLVLGDAQYEDGRYREYQRSYDRSWGTLMPITRPVPGNHDYHTSGARGYLRYFGARARPRGTMYYSLRVGGWLILGINSNCGAVGCTHGSPQYEWLRGRLAEAPRCTLAFMHHARFSSGPHGNDPSVVPLWKLLFRGQADVVVAGHDHIYERFARLTPNGSRSLHGIRSFVSGLGGANSYAFSSTISHGSQYRFNERYGVLFLSLQQDGYAWRFVTTKGTTKDKGATHCH